MLKPQVRSSRLTLTCANAAMLRTCPQVKRGQPTRRKPRTQLRGTSPRRRRDTSVPVPARDGRAAMPGPNMNMDRPEM
jgi:hypothetical protein